MHPPRNEEIEFPIRLVCEAEQLRLAEDVVLTAMTEGSRLRLLGIEKAEFDEHGRINSYVSRGADPFSDFIGPDLDSYDQLYSSNYVASVPNIDVARDLNFALKLADASCTSLFVGKGRSGSTSFIYPPCYYGSQPLTVAEETAENLSTLLMVKRTSAMPKLKLIADMLLYAMSVAPRNESRFIELSVILEMLLLPTASSELSYRFALRLAKFSAKYFGADATEVFAAGQMMYRTRSRLVHAGRDADLQLVAPLVEDAVRKLVAKYMEDPRLFDEAALDALCISP